MPPKSSSSPRGWPRELVYLHAPRYSKKLNGDATKALVVPNSAPSLRSIYQVPKSQGPYTNVRITPISNPAHPANGQYGLYAAHNLPPDAFILPYLGYVHGPTDLDEQSDYDLSLDREQEVGVDASRMGNEARFINDYRGISNSPNAEFRDISVDVGNGGVEKRMGVFVLSAGKSGKRAKGIGKGEEILVSYGKGFWSERAAMKQ
ncbi:hypothetical protein CC80DRAFT_555500 [Byssothecium circinans]|uniref:SET domain-containing protein n=1 Tax=Byssothecium circinans TaxID=147558 RepID=A0A6A5T9F0_9PLEO|nr:hypothetical protein CC80DRAFT_555500 [Byssothecium circinans]